ncbi:NTP transferase domain-containing protein [Aquihabitans sp. G128]|uniref:bifunctional UDP-N-acetylglucosamine diphosphorylase/glucosamine-1-phosphate N-acetyltransferase GlmU n=1 Tax=Aquihabitans sp. G128 TaxID=2849779 RepID=UPI001C213732|nr:NTP transferase domain-containing protein [Aquihabitans sp. G128]QXC61002.1 NTP transferase domain-containing protein [Aquihabitans sp. G128]
MSERSLSAIVLAAGAGTRMKSSRPKPLHLLAGRSMLQYVLDSLADCSVERVVVVVGHGAERVTKKLQAAEPDLHLTFVEQSTQNGTGDAASVGLTGLPDDDGPESDLHDVVVLPGDMPLLQPATLAALVAAHRAADAACTVLTARVPDPGSYGRVVRGKDDQVVRIVEKADATPEELEIDEINTAVYCFRRSVLAPALRRITPDNAQGEFYLTDVVAVLREAGYRVGAVEVEDPADAEGINDRLQLATAEAELRRRTNERWLRAGVTLVDPASTYLDATVQLASDVTLFPGTILQGATVIGAGAEIGPHTRLVDCIVGAGAVVEQSNGRDAEIGADATVGPFAALAPGASIPDGTVTGPFYAAPGPDDA